MQKMSPPLDAEGYKHNTNRLQAISVMTLGALTDEVVLELLAERRSLMKENSLYESIRDEQARRVAALTVEEQVLESEIEELNTTITPDKDDDTLLALIQHRKELETKLKALGLEEARLSEGLSQEVQRPEEESKKIPMALHDVLPNEIVSTVKGTGDDTEGLVRSETIISSGFGLPPSENTPEELQESIVEKQAPEETPSEKAKVSDALIGSEGVQDMGGTGAEEYLQLLHLNPEEALARLETLPENFRKNKAFMLAVAKVDPAYAMHYADSKTLKRDEDFNVRIAAMKNPRDSGNPLAEMLSDMRTNQVVMTAVKQDFRNLRYATRSMEGYAEMIEIAKREAREKVRSLGQAVDVRVFLPKTLREDREFLKEIEGIVEKLREKTPQE